MNARAWCGVVPALLIGCAGEPAHVAAPGPRSAPDPASSSLVLVTLDTFRADAVGSGGSPDAHTPWLDLIARTGVEFSTGLSASPLTAPSHTSILTGRIPPAHGVRDNGTFRLAAGIPTLATELQRRGFATGGFIGAFPLLGRFGLARGFDVYDDDIGDLVSAQAFRMAQRSGGRVADAALAWLKRVPAGRRLFGWVHLFDAHAPYEPPAVWRHAARGSDYGGDVAWTDSVLGRVVRAVELRGDTWLVVQADHGESLGQHEEDTHAIFVYDATVRIPAVVWPPPEGEPAGLRRAVFRNMDVPATAFGLLGLDPAAAPGRGVSVFSEPAGPAYLESMYASFHYGWSEIQAVRDGRWKYIRTAEPELYDVEADPGERRNLHDERQDVTRRLAALLDGMLADETAAPGVELTAADRDALESLGYVTGAAESVPAGDRPDAKSMMRVQRNLYDAMRAMSARRYADAGRSLRSALSRDPDNKEVHRIMGMLYAEQGRDDLAVDSFRRALEVGPDADDEAARLVLAASLMRLRLYDEAARHFAVIAHDDSLNPEAWFNLGQARRAQERMEDARAAFRKALALKPDLQLARDALLQTSGSEGGRTE